MESYVFDSLPNPVPESNYICSDEFKTEILKRIFLPQESYGLAIITRGGAIIGEKQGEKIRMIEEFESNVPGKHRKGGQSAQRFKRDIEERKKKFFKKVAQKLKDEFIAEGELQIEGLVLGGTTITVKDFLDTGVLDSRLEEAVLGTFGIEYMNKEGLERLVSEASSLIEDAEQKEVRDALDEFYTRIRDEEKKVVYGEDEVDTAIEYGAVDTLLIDENYDGDIESITTRVEEKGGDVLFVPSETSDGEQFNKAFGGLGALLRYPIN